MGKKQIALLLALLLLTGLFAGCGQTKTPSAPEPAQTEAPAEPVVLTVAGGWPDCRALDEVATAFTEKYPNCTIQYEYVQDFYASMTKRLEGDEPVDLFFTINLQEGTDLLPYALDLGSRTDLDLSQTFPGLIENFRFREGGAVSDKLYSIPLGAELRGLYVNKTLLDSLGLAVPTDQAELLAACETLKENGYIAFHGNPGNFAQLLLYPWICNLIANAQDPQAAFDRVDAGGPGLGEMFREPYAFLYTLVENGYYDYKRAQTELDLFTDTTDEAYAMDFLNIAQSGESRKKLDDVGQVAFLPSPMSMQSTMEKVREDYHSEIEYVFIPAPVGPEGGYAYLSPAHGIAAAAASENVDWAVRFLDFLYQPENNLAFAQTFNIIPNTAQAFSYITDRYDVPDDHICQLGQVTFRYGFYDLIQASLTDVSKGNNPKYMQDDGSGDLSLYPLQYYLDQLEESIEAQ